MTRAASLLVAIALAACQGPEDWSPAAEHHRDETRRAATLAAHLETLPGIAHASVILDEPFADPLAPPAPAPPPRASVVLALASDADPAAVTTDVRRAVLAAVPSLADDHLSVIAAPAPAAPRPRDRLRIPLALALAAIVALAGWIALILLQRRRAAVR